MKIPYKVSSTWIICYLNKESQNLVPTRNFSHLEPQKFVPTNHKKSPIRKIKLPQNFHATRYILKYNIIYTCMKTGTVRVNCLVCQNSFAHTFVVSVGPSSCFFIAIEITQTIVVRHWIQNIAKYVQYNALRESVFSFL